MGAARWGTDHRYPDRGWSFGTGPIANASHGKGIYWVTIPSAEVQAVALVELLKEAHFRTSPHRATAEYRRHLAEVLLQEAVNMRLAESRLKSDMAIDQGKMLDTDRKRSPHSLPLIPG